MVRSQQIVDIPGMKRYYEKMNRKHTAINRMLDRRNNDYVSGSPAYRLSMVWPLTHEVVSFSKRYDAERRLQRHVASLGRREG
jgi:hypothetical protein